jgi:hypothetical protein
MMMLLRTCRKGAAADAAGAALAEAEAAKIAKLILSIFIGCILC